jgi:ATP-dependent DNA helicase PIF1
MGDLVVIHGTNALCNVFNFNRFIFWALNTKLRWQAQSQGKVFMRKQIGAPDLTVADIQERLQANDKPTFIGTIQRYMEPVCGLSPFWNKNRRQLMAMVKQLHCGHLFFTLSAADTHWPELHRIIEEARAVSTSGPPLDFSTLDPEAARRRRVDNVINYPHICAAFLHSRVRLFLDIVQKIPGLKFVDYWCRYEWQFRGSGHLHGILWLEGAPNVSGRDLTDEGQKQELLDFFSQIVYACAPIPNHPPPAVNPCQAHFIITALLTF